MNKALAFEVFFNQASLSAADDVLVICDRGAMDPSAYIDNEQWQKCLEELSLEQFNLREARYDQVYISLSLFISV